MIFKLKFKLSIPEDIFNDAFIGLDVELKLEPIQLDEESVPLLIVGKEEKGK